MKELSIEKIIDLIEDKAPVHFEMEEGEEKTCTMYFEDLRNYCYDIQFTFTDTEDLLQKLKRKQESWMWEGVVEFFETFCSEYGTYGCRLDHEDKVLCLKRIDNTYKKIAEAIHDLEILRRYM